MMWAVSVQALALLVVAAPPVVRRDPGDDLMKVQAAFQSAKSWHADEHFSNGKTTVVEYVAPDRWRIVLTPTMAEMLIGNDVYIVRNGQANKVPMSGAMMEKMFASVRFSVQDEIKQSAKDLGMQTVDGQSLHEYSFTASGMPVQLYVNSDMLPVRSVSTAKNVTTTIVYSQYNGSISIQP